jgi:dihydroorotase
METFLIRGGTVYDGSGAPGHAADVRVHGEQITDIGPNLPHHPGEQIVDATGLIVSPGLIDLHVHVFSGVGRWSVDPDQAGLRTGVTTLLDTGTAGALTYPAFHRFVIEPAGEDVFALLNIAAIGCLQGDKDTGPHSIGELSQAGYFDVPSAVACAQQFADRIIGFKVRLSANLADHKAENERAALDAALNAAEQTGLPLMVHHARSQVPLAELLARLAPATSSRTCTIRTRTTGLARMARRCPKCTKRANAASCSTWATARARSPGPSPSRQHASTASGRTPSAPTCTG